jgi:hypothetical protein
MFVEFFASYIIAIIAGSIVAVALTFKYIHEFNAPKKYYICKICNETIVYGKQHLQRHEIYIPSLHDRKRFLVEHKYLKRVD